MSEPIIFVVDSDAEALAGAAAALPRRFGADYRIEGRPPYPLETSIPGVFAVGDGSLAVRSVYEYLHKLG